MTVLQPFTMVTEMWSAFEVLATNKTPAINGQRYHATFADGHLTYSALTPPLHGSPTRVARTQWDPLPTH